MLMFVPGKEKARQEKQQKKDKTIYNKLKIITRVAANPHKKTRNKRRYEKRIVV